MYHGIIIDKEFKDPSFLKFFKVFAKKKAGDWEIYGIEIEDSETEKIIKRIQENLRSNEPWYCHFYNNKELIVIFKEKIFRMGVQRRDWRAAIDYGKDLGVPDEQLDFQPTRFQEERQYFV